MKNMEHSFDSANQCVKDETDKASGAGANAGSEEDMVLITNTPLSELVWSQHNGLGLQCVASSLAGKKSSLLWNTESFNIIIPSPQHANCGESSNTRDFAEGNMELLKWNPNAKEENYDGLALGGSPRSTIGRNPISLIRTHEQELRNKQPVETEGVIVSLGDENSSFNRIRPETEAVDMMCDKNFIPGSDNYGPSAESLLCNMKESRPDLACVEVEHTSNVQTSPDHVRVLNKMENYQTSSFIIVPADHNSFLGKHGSPMRSSSSSGSAEFKEADLSSDQADVNVNSRVSRQIVSSNSFDRKCSGEGGSLGLGLGMPPQPADEDNDGTSPASEKVISGNIGSLLEGNINKDKRHAPSDTEDSASTSKESEDSHESVESSNSKQMTPTGKRDRSRELNICVATKRLKKDGNERSCSHSFQRQGSSFMNWISTLTNGFSRFTEATPLSFVPRPFHHTGENLKSSSPLQCRNMGFKSIFEALRNPGLSIEASTNGYPDHQREADASEELKVETEQSVHSTCQLICERVEFNLHRTFPTRGERVTSSFGDHASSEQINTSNFHRACDGDGDNFHRACDRDGDKLPNEVSTSIERLNQGISHAEEYPSIKITSHPGQTCNNLSNIASTSSFVKKRPLSPSGGKGESILVAVSNSSPNLMNSNGFLKNLWVTRLFPKVSSAIANSEEHKDNMIFSTESLTNNCNAVGPFFQDAAEHNFSESHRPSSLEAQKDVMNGEKQFEILPINVQELKKIGAQKLESELTPLFPSQMFRKAKPIASTFAKRLDALRHRKISKVSSDLKLVASTCFFCGQSDHNIRECPQISETELVDLLKNMHSYADIGKPSCLCIRCFQLGHWAIGCPHASSKGIHVTPDAFSTGYENCVRRKKGRINPSSGDCVGKVIAQSEDEQQGPQNNSRHVIPRKGNVGVEIDLIVHSNVISSTMERKASPVVGDLNLRSLKKNVEESTVKANPASSKSGENELMGSKILPVYHYFATEVTDESVAIFETIKRLRLSRMDVIRWMKSPNSQLNLRGFFLRLRLGKWEEGSGGTGYHVAFINGATSENCISVCVAGLTYLIDRRFISNHDFVEDELKAWWSTSLKDGGKPPSREELNKKLQERMKLWL